MKRIAAIALVFVLAGCPSGSLSPDATAFAVCSSYKDALVTLAVFQGRLSPTDRVTLQEADAILKPACEAAKLGGKFDIKLMRNSLRRLVVLQEAERNK